MSFYLLCWCSATLSAVTYDSNIFYTFFRFWMSGTSDKLFRLWLLYIIETIALLSLYTTIKLTEKRNIINLSLTSHKPRCLLLQRSRADFVVGNLGHLRTTYEIFNNLFLFPSVPFPILMFNLLKSFSCHSLLWCCHFAPKMCTIFSFSHWFSLFSHEHNSALWQGPCSDSDSQHWIF